MNDALDVLMVALYVLGCMTLMLAVFGRWVARMPDSRGKFLFLGAYVAAWVGVAVGTAWWVGLSGFAESYLFRAQWPRPLLAPVQWMVSTVPVVAAVTWTYAARKTPPAEVLSAQTRLRQVDMSGLQGMDRLLTRGDLARFEVVELTLALPGLPSGLDGLRVVHLADVHYGGPRARLLMRAVEAEVHAAGADVAVIAGDIINDHQGLDEVATLLAGLGTPCGTFAVLGNHDFWFDAEQTTRALERRGVKVLRNEGTRIERGGDTLWLAGVDDYWSPTADLEAALRGRQEGETCVLLAHNPDAVMEAARRGVTLQLSGHTHGGQVSLPLVGPLVVPSDHGRRFAEGLHKVEHTVLYVSRGLSVYFAIRTGSTPQIIFITLRPAPAPS